MNCNADLDHILYQRLIDYIMSEEEKTIEGAKAFIGITDEKWGKLIEDESFSNLVSKLK